MWRKLQVSFFLQVCFWIGDVVFISVLGQEPLVTEWMLALAIIHFYLEVYLTCMRDTFNCDLRVQIHLSGSVWATYSSQFVCHFLFWCSSKCLPNTHSLTHSHYSLTHSHYSLRWVFTRKCLSFVALHLAHICSPCTTQQPSDPAVVSVSEAPVPAQQQKNIFQVCMLAILSG